MIKLKCICGYIVGEPAVGQQHYWHDMMRLHMMTKHGITGKFDDLLIPVIEGM